MNSESKERTDSDNPSEFLMVAKTWNNYHKIMKRSEHVIINEVSLCLLSASLTLIGFNSVYPSKTLSKAPYSQSIY